MVRPHSCQMLVYVIRELLASIVRPHSSEVLAYISSYKIEGKRRTEEAQNKVNSKYEYCIVTRRSK